jgi:AP endonuclease-1
MTSRVTRSRSQRDLREVEKIDESPNDRKRIASETTQSSSPRGPKRIKRTKDEQYKSRVSSELEVDPASTTRVRNGSKADSTQDATSAAVRIKRTVEEEAEEEEEEEQEAEGTVIRTKRTRKKKVKKDEVVEMKPLATRTHGLRMFIGAHVSAAKGVYCISSRCRSICLSRLNTLRDRNTQCNQQ